MSFSTPIILPELKGLDCFVSYLDGKFFAEEGMDPDFILMESAYPVPGLVTYYGKLVIGKKGQYFHIFDKVVIEEMKNEEPMTLFDSLNHISEAGLTAVQPFPIVHVPARSELIYWALCVPFAVEKVNIFENTDVSIKETIDIPQVAQISIIKDLQWVKSGYKFIPYLLTDSRSVKAKNYNFVKNKGMGTGAKIIDIEGDLYTLDSKPVTHPSRCIDCKTLLSIETTNLICKQCKKDES